LHPDGVLIRVRRRGFPVNERHSPGLNKRRLGRLLTRFREDAGLTLAQAAERLYTSRSAVSRLETGGTKVNVHILKSMLDVYNIGGDRWPGLIQMAVRSGEKGWWHEFGPGVAGTYVDFETEVEELFMFGLAIVPGLLQTAEYARVMFRHHYRGRRDIEDVVRRQIAVRMARQERLVSERPLRLTVVMDESALMRPLGGPDVLTAQLVHLAEVATLPRVDVRVLPLGTAYEGLEGAFTIMRFPRELEEPDIVYHQYPFNEQFLDRPEQVALFHRLFRDMRAEALSPDDSISVFQRHAEL
jgi:transcriptional regulator with XRE-family HTH domain